MNKRITKISAKNLKGQSFEHDLNKITVIVGDNEAGKTARFDAILLAQLGYKLKPGEKPMKTAAKIFRSCGCRGGGATELDVKNTMSDGEVIHRNWTMKRGKITYAGPEDGFIPPMMLDPSGFFAISGPERRNLVLSQVDLEELGIGYQPLKTKLESEFVTIINSLPTKAAYLEVTDKLQDCDINRQTYQESIYDWLTKVVDAITVLRDKEASTVDTHDQTVRGLTDNKATDNDMTAMQSVQPDINAARERHTAAVTTEATALAAFTAADRRLQETKTLATMMVDETAIQALITVAEAKIEQHRLIKPPTLAFRAKVMPTERPTDTGERHARGEADSKAQEANRRAQEALLEMKRLEGELEAAKTAVNESAPAVEAARLVAHPGPRPTPKVMTCRPTETTACANWQTANTNLDTARRRTRETSYAVSQLGDNIEIAKARTNCPTCGHDITEQQAKIVADLKAKLEIAQADDKTAGEAEQAALLAEQNAARRVGEVQADIASWEIAKQKLDTENDQSLADWRTRNDAHESAQRTITAAQATAAKITPLQEALKTASGRHVGTSAVAAVAVGHLADAQSVLEVAEKEIQAWDAQKAALDRENQEAVRAHNTATSAYNNAQAAINAAQTQISQWKISIAAVIGRVRSARQELPALETASREAADAYRAAKEAVPAIAEQIRTLEISQRQFIARSQNDRIAQQSRDQLATANERLAVFKAALNVVTEEKIRAESEAFNSLLKHARKMTDGNLRAPLEFRDGELGIVSDGNWVDISEFSGKQQKFAFAGLGLALTQKSNGVRIVMLDEMGTLTRENKIRMITRLLELIDENVIDQAVLADVSAADYTGYAGSNDCPPDFNVSVITIDNTSEQF